MVLMLSILTVITLSFVGLLYPLFKAFIFIKCWDLLLTPSGLILPFNYIQVTGLLFVLNYAISKIKYKHKQDSSWQQGAGQCFVSVFYPLLVWFGAWILSLIMY